MTAKQYEFVGGDESCLTLPLRLTRRLLSCHLAQAAKNVTPSPISQQTLCILLRPFLTVHYIIFIIIFVVLILLVNVFPTCLFSAVTSQLCLLFVNSILICVIFVSFSIRIFVMHLIIPLHIVLIILPSAYISSP